MTEAVNFVGTLLHESNSQHLSTISFCPTINSSTANLYEAMTRSATSSAKSSVPESSTSVLSAGTVEGRGHGVKHTDSRQLVHAEIQAFLDGQDKIGWRSETRSFFTVWMFLTRLPGPSWIDHHPGYVMRGMAYFPVVGTFIGAFVSVFFDLAVCSLSLPHFLGATFSLASSFWVTGCFHEDGVRFLHGG
jgi:hypothetical protein